jgi:hypothetical protein
MKSRKNERCGPQKMNSDGLITLHAPGARIRGAGQQELRSPRSGNSWESYDARSESPLLENIGQAYQDQDWNADAPDCSATSSILELAGDALR